MKLRKDIAALRMTARAEVDEIFVRRLSSILGPFSAVHARKAQEAERVIQGATSMLLAPEAHQRGLTEEALARAVLAKAERQTAQIAALEAERQDAQAAIDAAANPIELEAILSQHR